MTTLQRKEQNAFIVRRVLLFTLQWLVGWTMLTVGMYLWLGRDNSVVWLIVPVLSVISLIFTTPRLLKSWEGDIVDVRDYLQLINPPGRDPVFHDEAVAVVRTRGGRVIEMPADWSWTIGDHIVKEVGEIKAHKAA